MDTNPRRYLVRMFVFLLAVGIIATLLAAPLITAFMGNPASVSYTHLTLPTKA